MSTFHDTFYVVSFEQYLNDASLDIKQELEKDALRHMILVTMCSVCGSVAEHINNITIIRNKSTGNLFMTCSEACSTFFILREL